MADYGLVTLNPSGQIIFGLSTNAGRFLGELYTSTSGSIVVPGFADGIAWALGQCFVIEEPRKFTLSISGTTLTYTLSATAVGSATVRILYGIR